MLKFAFYKAPGSLTDRAIRLASGSRYSHVEFVTADGLCISASKRDGNRVRAKVMRLNPAHWDYVCTPGDDDKGRAYALSQVGTQYNTWGAVASALPIKRDVGHGLFCSEFMGLICIAGGVHVDAPWTLTPGELHTILRRP